ncbi:MAG: hypothetical protein JKY48_10535, partial [Flavobacteriales bacterium]|nr:hypothetical protein [Flavobacteriales bacterium]
MKLPALLSLSTVVLLLSSCFYSSFVKYSMNKEGFKNFSKKEKLAGNTTNPHRAYHINKYDWNIQVFPDKKKLEGTMGIHFSPEIAQDTFLFDLQKRMKIYDFKTSIPNSSIKRKGDLLYLIFEGNIPANKRVLFSINYGGKPVSVAGEGPMNWKEDLKFRPWISTITEGIGPHFIMPCSALLGKEPDSTEINITAPLALIAAANGQLLERKENKEKQTATTSFLVSYPINIYNISFNLGHFVKFIKPYTDIKGNPREIECYVLDYNQEVADTFYNQAPKMMQVFEEAYGSFPWWNDGCRFIESTFSAMEHQSGIAMGDDYNYDWKDEWNTTLAHELAHEWWGNNITGIDYCDIWIHEGMATYSEALFLESIYGREAYESRIRKMVFSTYNSIPIHKVCGVLYNSWLNGPDQDIYDKGGLMMHSLRKVVNNDELFMTTLKQIQEEYGPRNISSEEMIEQLNTLLAKDYSPLLNWYLDEQKPP